MPLSRTLRIALLPVALAASSLAQSPYDAVNPLIGTDGGGNTFPGATLPFGMIQWSPDTNAEAWYEYNDKQITGFSLTHISGAELPTLRRLCRAAHTGGTVRRAGWQRRALHRRV